VPGRWPRDPLDGALGSAALSSIDDQTQARPAAPYAALVDEHGLSPAHRFLLDSVPAGARVLDVGCATGYLAAELARRGCRVIGVEADPVAAERARVHCEALVIGDVEDEDCRSALAALAPFDIVLCGDVLEHLRDPWTALRALAALSARDGRVVLSVPNVAHWTGRRALARGRFPYAEHGLFDRTHLRFFTRASARELAQSAGLRVVEERFAPAPVPMQARLPALRALEQAAVRLRPELFALQVILVCEASGSRR
jgi:2-polyprenyl-3-methyl-5-hydroxy-6-metoxy-1,4-benzoquinol methylase